MKEADVVVGATYYCNIGAELCAVVVIMARVARPWEKGSRITYQVRRVDSQTPLSKWRTAAALRVENRKKW